MPTARAEIIFPLSSAPSELPLESGGRLINTHAEPVGDGRTKLVRAPGIRVFATSPSAGPRGMIQVNAQVFAAFSGATRTFTSGGGAMGATAALAGAEDVFFARNNVSPTPDLVVVTENGAFKWSGATWVAYPDVDLPQPNSVCSIDGYLVFTIGDGRAFATDLNTTAVNALSFGDANAKPDGLIRGVASGGRLFLFGTETTEIDTDVGAIPFPFQRSFVMPFGLLTATAVAGQEDGFGAGLIFVAHDYSVRQVNGYAAEKISPPWLDRLIQRETDKTHIRASVYVADGKSFWVLTGSTWTAEFNLNSEKWNERESWLVNRWRGMQTLRAFDQWLIMDRDSGDVGAIDPTVYREFGAVLRSRMESQIVTKFPDRTLVSRADFLATMGVGIGTGVDPIETDPSVEITCSRNGGYSWGTPWIRKLGRQGVGDKRLFVTRAGLSTSQGHRWRVDVADPVPFSVMGGVQLGA